MPTVTLNRMVIEKLVGKKLSTTDLKDRMAMLGTDVESVDNKEIVVEVFPNRPDMLSEQGFGRALGSFSGVGTGLKKYNIKKSGYKVFVDKSVHMRPYTACALIKNLVFTDERIREVMQMQEKLATTHGRNRKKSAYGVYPLQGIHFPIYYIAKDPRKVLFQPLGSRKKAPAINVEEHHPTGKKFHHLARDWQKYPFFIDNTDNVLSMLPYTNSEDTGKIDETTTEVFIECTGTDLQNVSLALNMFVTMFAEMGGDIYSLDIVYPGKTVTTPNLSPQKMKLDLPYINKRLGLNLKHSEAKKYLEKMGYGLSGNNVLIPAYRADILHQCDLVEDIAIAYGYDNIAEEIPQVATIAEEFPLNRFIKKVTELLVGAGLQEIHTYHLLSFEELTSMMNKNNNVIPLRNSLVDYGCVRNSIIPSLLKILAQNQHHDYPQNIFEIGTTFHPDKKAQYNIAEKNTLAITLCHEKSDFTTIRQVIDLLCNAFSVECKIDEVLHPSFIEGRTAKVIANKKELAVFGELHPQPLTNFNLPMPVAAAEINLDILFDLVQQAEKSF